MYLTGVPRCDVKLLDHIIEADDDKYNEHKVLITFKIKISTTNHINQLSINRTFSSPLLMLTSENRFAEPRNPSLISIFEVETLLAEFRIPALRNIIYKILDGVNVMAQRRECLDQQRFSVLRMVVELDLLVRQLPNIPAFSEDDVITDTDHLYYVRFRSSNASEIRREIYSDFSFHEHGSLLVETARDSFGDDDEEMGIEFFDDYYDEIRFEASSEESIKDLEKVIVISEVISCTVCLEEIEVGSEATGLPCLHRFHGDCIVKWLQTSKYCPVCRFQI